MRFQRLLLETGQEATWTSLDFHPAMTVVTGTNDANQGVVRRELINSLTTGRKGVHVELRTDRGRSLAVIRSDKAADMVLDADQQEDVTAEFTADGAIDLLSGMGLDPIASAIDMGVARGELMHRGADDRDLDRLARLDQGLLFELVEEVKRTTALVTQTESEFQQSIASVNAPKENREQLDEAVEAYHEMAYDQFSGSNKRTGLYFAIAAVLAALTAAGLVLATSIITIAAFALALAAALYTGYRFLEPKMQERKFRSAVADSGEDSLFSAQLGRVDGLLESGAIRSRKREAVEARDRAQQAWADFTGSADLNWVGENQELLARAAEMHRTAGLDPSQASETFGALVARLTFAAAEDPKLEALPVIIEEPFEAMRVEERHAALQLLAITAQNRQRIVVSNDPEVLRWAKAGEAEQYLSILSLSQPAPAPAAPAQPAPASASASAPAPAPAPAPTQTAPAPAATQIAPAPAPTQAAPAPAPTQTAPAPAPTQTAPAQAAPTQPAPAPAPAPAAESAPEAPAPAPMPAVMNTTLPDMPATLAEALPDPLGDPLANPLGDPLGHPTS